MPCLFPNSLGPCMISNVRADPSKKTLPAMDLTIYPLPLCNLLFSVLIFSCSSTKHEYCNTLFRFQRGILQRGSVNFIQLAGGSTAIGKDQCVSSCCRQPIRNSFMRTFQITEKSNLHPEKLDYIVLCYHRSHGKIL